MINKNAKKILEYIMYGGFILSTILVFIFQFVGIAVLARIALALYSASFVVLAVLEFMSSVEQSYQITLSKNIIKDEKDIITENSSSVEVKDKIFSIIKGCISAVFAIFTLVVCILL